MDRLDGLLGGRSGSKNGESNSGEPSREPRVNFNEQQNRRMATAFEPLNRSLQTFLTRLCRTNERSEKSRRVFQKNQDAIKTNLMAVLIPG